MKFFPFRNNPDSFSGNVLKLVSGASVAQIFGILVTPIVTRLFAPDAYGTSTLFLSITAIIGVIACLRYEFAIMLPETDGEAANILAVSLGVTLLFSVISAIVVILGGDLITHLLDAPDLGTYLWLVPIAVFLGGISLCLNYWNSRTKHFGRLSIIQVISSVTAQATKLSAGFAGFVSGGVLILSGMLSGIVSAGLLSARIWKDDKILFKNHVRWQSIWEGFCRYKKFPIIDTWGGLLNCISWQLPVFMLSSFFSISVVGLFALALSVIMMPLNLVGSAISQVFYQKTSDEKNIPGKNGILVEEVMDKLMLIGILPTLVLAIIGEELFTIIFGQKWFEAGRYTQILAPWILFWFISSPLSTLFSVYERQGSAFFVHFIIFLTRVISLYVGGIYHDIYLALTLFSVTGIVAYAGIAMWNINLAKADRTKIASRFLKYLLYAVPIGIGLILVKYTFHLGPFISLFSAIVMSIIYIFAFRSKYYFSFSCLVAARKL